MTRQATSLGQVTFAPLQELELQVAFNRWDFGRKIVRFPEKVDISQLHSLKLTAIAPTNGWLEYDRLSYWVKRPIFRGEMVSFREGN